MSENVPPKLCTKNNYTGVGNSRLSKFDSGYNEIYTQALFTVSFLKIRNQTMVCCENGVTKFCREHMIDATGLSRVCQNSLECKYDKVKFEIPKIITEF